MEVWKEAKTKEGRVYYYNPKTKESRWTKPEHVKPNFSGTTTFTPNHRLDFSGKGSPAKRLNTLLQNEEELNRMLKVILTNVRQQGVHPFVGKSMSVFQNYDTKCTGSLDAEEFSSMMSEIGQPISLDRAKEVIHDYDTDGNGQMEFDEFLHYLGY